MKKTLLIAALCISSFAFAQKTIPLPIPNPKAIEAAMHKAGSSPVYHFAVSVDVNYTFSNSGEWQELEDGSHLWKARFIAPGSKNLHFWLKNVNLPEGASLKVYSEGGQQHADVYDSRNLSRAPYFGIWPVYGGDVWLEYYEPLAVKGQGTFEIFRAGIGYRDMYARSGPVAPPSLECNYDVECFMEGIENLKNYNKRSVALILADTGDGVFLASGALVNNTANDGKPYILSANHAWVENTMYTFRFNWRNPHPDCPSSGWGDQSINANHTITGATLRARRDKTDFLLMEIDSEIPEEWGLVWSGWDRTGIPSDFTYCIHHPAGDIMKICLDVDSPEILNQSNGDLKWLIHHWEIGTTEGGSSGSPLLTDEGRIIGQLWAGASGCTGSQPNAYADNYGRFDRSWADGSTPATMLREWLDPGNTGVMTLDFYPPLPDYVLDGELKFIDPGHDTCDSDVQSVIRLVNNGNTPITSAVIQYSVNGNAPQVYNWAGSLAKNQGAVINLPLVEGLVGDNTFTITLISVNGTTDENQQNDVLETFFDKWIYDNQQVFITAEIEDFWGNIAWRLTDDDGDLIYASGPYTNYAFFLSDGCYKLTVYASPNMAAAGYFLFEIGQNEVLMTEDFSQTREMSFMLYSQLGAHSQSTPGVGIYPNPSSGIFRVAFGNEDTAHYTVYNPLGQEVVQGDVSKGQDTIDLSGFAAGIYSTTITFPTGASGSYRIIKK